MPNTYDAENLKSQMRKGILEFCILEIVSRQAVYANDILRDLHEARLLVVEGTLYPLLTRLRHDGLLDYEWIESSAGPPRKYYSLTPLGKRALTLARAHWNELAHAVQTLSNL